MNLFFDTSALVKLFHEEPGSDLVTSLIKASHNTIWLLELSRIEFYSALFRRFRNSELSDEDLKQAINGFNNQLNGFRVEPLSHAIVNEAELLIQQYGKEHGLRSLDSLHLAAYILISEKEWQFVAADFNLLSVARAIGLNTINPLID
jgi:predicted nucleic acid-binding protein